MLAKLFKYAATEIIFVYEQASEAEDTVNRHSNSQPLAKVKVVGRDDCHDTKQQNKRHPRPYMKVILVQVSM